MAAHKNSSIASDSDVRAALPADEDSTAYLDHDTLAAQIFGGKTTSVPAVAVAKEEKIAGAFAFAKRLRRGLPVLGISVASLAVAGLAAGEPTLAAGFGLFLMLIIGLSTVTIRAIRA